MSLPISFIITEKSLFINEFFAPITKFAVPDIIEGMYSISNYGRLWSHATGRILIGKAYTVNEYNNIDICFDLICNGGSVRISLTELMCRVFYGNKTSLFPNMIDNKSRSVFCSSNVEWGEYDKNQKEKESRIYTKNHRTVCGESSHLSKISEAEAREICELLEKGEISMSAIAKMYNVHRNAIFNIRHGKTWKHVSKDYDIPEAKSNDTSNDRHTAYISEVEAHKICKMLKDGYSSRDISNKLNIPQSVVGNIRTKRTWVNISDQYGLTYDPSDRAHGENNGGAVITNEQAHEICKLLEEGVSNVEIAKKFNISQALVSSIKSGYSWTHISKYYNIKKVKFSELHGENNPHSTITDQQAHEICKLLESGKSCTEISTMLDISIRIVNSIKCGKSWKHVSKEYNMPGDMLHGENNIRCIYKEEQIRKVCEMIEKGYKLGEISEATGVSKDVIKSIRLRRSWKNISNEYKW